MITNDIDGRSEDPVDVEVGNQSYENSSQTLSYTITIPDTSSEILDTNDITMTSYGPFVFYSGASGGSGSPFSIYVGGDHSMTLNSDLYYEHVAGNKFVHVGDKRTFNSGKRHVDVTGDYKNYVANDLTLSAEKNTNFTTQQGSTFEISCVEFNRNVVTLIEDDKLTMSSKTKTSFTFVFGLRFSIYFGHSYEVSQPYSLSLYLFFQSKLVHGMSAISYWLASAEINLFLGARTSYQKEELITGTTIKLQLLGSFEQNTSKKKVSVVEAVATLINKIERAEKLSKKLVDLRAGRSESGSPLDAG